MAFGTSTLGATVRATEAAGLSGYNQAFQYQLDTTRQVNLMESYYFEGAKQVASALNEVKYDGPLYLQGRKSLETNLTMSTTSSKVSPVVDLQRTNATIVRNLIDNPNYSEDIFGITNVTLTFNGDISDTELETGDFLTFTDGSETRTVTITDLNTSTNKVKVKGQYAGVITTQTVLDDPDLQAVGIQKVTIPAGSSFVPETNNNGSVYAKWISRLFLFENACDGMELKLGAIFYNSEDIKVYYRPRNIGFDGELANVNWIPFNGTGLPNDVESIKPRSSDDVNPNRLRADDWQTLTWSVQDIAKFDGVAIKVVMTSDNPAQAPLIDDLQMVVSE